MSSDVLTRVRIFISSPSDVDPERQGVIKAVQRLNQVRSIADKYKIEALSYTLDASPISGKTAQVVIDESMGEAKDSYLVIVIFWSRLGQAFVHPKTHVQYESGTLYEFSTAYEALMAHGSPQILVYRKLGQPPEGITDPHQYQLVNDFFRRFEGSPPQYEGLYKTFTTSDVFDEMIFRDIQFVLEQYPPDNSGNLSPEKLETIQSKRLRLAALLQSNNPAANDLRLDIRRELRQTLSPMPFQRYSRFIGRRDKIDLVLKKIDEKGVNPIIAIDGIGGVGKTALAYEIAKHALDQNLVEAVVWESDRPDEFVGGAGLPATEEIDINDLLNNIGRHLGFFDIFNLPQAQKVAFLKQALNERDRYLIIVDNLDTMKGYRDVALCLGQIVSLTKVVLTSRVRVDQINIFEVGLSGLAREESIEFLREEGAARGDSGKAIQYASDDALQQIWKATEGMPLAMKLIVGQVSHSSLSHVLHRLEDFRSSGHTGRSSTMVFSDFYQYIYKATWEALPEIDQSILIYLSSYDPIEGARYSSLVQSVQEDMGLSQDELDDSVSDLIDFSLVTVVEEPGERRYTLHPLTRNYIRNLS